VTSWKRLPNGTRVRHLRRGYEGWIDRVTELKNLHDGPTVNLDGRTQYGIRVLGEDQRRFAAEADLIICDDVDKIFLSTTGLLQITVGHLEIEPLVKSLPLPSTIWYLENYHARPELGIPRARLVPLRRIDQSEPMNPVDSGVDQRGRTIASRHHTHMINQLKLGTQSAVNHFDAKLNTILGSDFPIVIVPSHDPDMSANGLIELARKLASNGRVDASSCLVRHARVTASHQAELYGEVRRDMNRHLNSITIGNKALIASRVVLLLDDIVTTGTSLMACRELMLKAGVTEVICFALGKATW